jgi:uncharacterized protein (TIGR02231 family)
VLGSLIMTATIAQVVVFPSRAQVTRAEEVACGAAVVARFAAIPPAADPSTFRAAASRGTVEGLRAETQARGEAFAAQARALEDDLRQLGARIAAERDRQQRAQRADALAARLTDVTLARVGREMTEPAPNVKAWSGAFDSALAIGEQAAQSHVAAQARIRALEQQLDTLSRKRARLEAAAGRREHTAEVLVSCPAGQTTRVELTYLVRGASWRPAYEARADEETGTVELATYALVRQATGEDWTQARIILSTALPRQDATPPELQPLSLRAESRPPERKVLVRRDEYHEHAESGANIDSRAPARPTAGLAPEDQGLSVQLAVPEAADITGDDTPARLFVGMTRLKARFALRALPKLMPFAFRVADVVNTAPYPLLPGELDAFRGQGLMARYELERVAEGEPFHLTFGADESLRIKRVVVEEVKRDTGFAGSTRRFRYAYRYELANYHGRETELELSDHIPVSELKDVKVAIDARSTANYQLRGEDGIVTWRVGLRAGEQRNLELAFHVDAPASYDSGAL